jgi:hypothetical protein
MEQCSSSVLQTRISKSCPIHTNQQQLIDYVFCVTNCDACGAEPLFFVLVRTSTIDGLSDMDFWFCVVLSLFVAQ